MRKIVLISILLTMSISTVMFVSCDSGITLTGSSEALTGKQSESEDTSQLTGGDLGSIEEDTNGSTLTSNNDQDQTDDEGFEVIFNDNDINVGETVTAKVMLDKQDITKDVIFFSDNESVLANQGNEKFVAKKVGNSNLTFQYNGKTKTINLPVHLRPELITGDRYSQVLIGIENCVGWTSTGGSYSVGTTKWSYNGDANDVYFHVSGEDLTLGVYNNRLYLVANKNQTIKFTSFTFWESSWGYVTHISYDSYLTMSIKDRDGKVYGTTNNFKICPENKIPGEDDKGQLSYHVLGTKSLSVKKGYAVDMTSYFKGAHVGSDQNCKRSSINFSEKSGYRLSTDSDEYTKYTNDAGYNVEYHTVKYK